MFQQKLQLRVRRTSTAKLGLFAAWAQQLPRQWLWLACTVFFALGCAGHAERTLKARSALDTANPQAALVALNEELKVTRAEDLPSNTGGDNALLLLDRAMVLQALDRYTLSSRDLEISDKQIEVLDLSRNAVADVGRYLYSDDAGPYKGPPYEKLLINTLNMVNYLAQGDLNGARIEARRFAVMRKYLKEREDKTKSLMGPGSYLAGFVFEKSGRPEEALNYYEEALESGSYATLAEPIARLAANAGARGQRISQLDTSKVTPLAGDEAELLVVLSYGRVPAKIARRIPIGLALTWAAGDISPFNRARANQLAAQGLVTWVNFPELAQARGTFDTPQFLLDGQRAALEGVVAIDQEAREAWKSARGAIIASAITRMITRVATGEVTRQVAGEGLLGALLGLGAQVALTAADTPDTRSWATLPARIALGRVTIKAGKHVVDLRARGSHKRQEFTVKPGGFAVINITVLK